MPKKLESYEFPGRRRKGKYPWDDLFDGGVWRVTKEDLDGTKPESFLGSVQQQASRREVKYRSHVEDDGSVVIQALSETS